MSKTQYKKGDIITLGDHILICGDAVDVTLPEKKIRLVCTDPPYGVAYVEGKDFLKLGKKDVKPIAGDHLQTDDEYRKFTKAWIQPVLGNLDSYNAFYIFHADNMTCPIRKAMAEAGLYYSQTVVWVKNSVVIGRKDFLPQHELIAYGWYGKHKTERSKAKSIMFHPKPAKAKLHPCLPAGESVYVNQVWKKIETVSVGDSTEYGRVSEITSHAAESIVEIEVDGRTCKATENHPFLVLRNDQILWVEAGQLLQGDVVLMNEKVYDTMDTWVNQEQKADTRVDMDGQPQVGTIDSNTKEGTSSCIDTSGKIDTERSRTDIRSTTKTETSKIIELRTSSLSTPLLTNECTLVASLRMESGTSHARYVEKGNQQQQSTGISQKGGSAEESVSRASSKKECETVRLVSHRVGSVKITKGKVKVYNLSIDGVPAFDTEIGVSHNTMKPIGLLRKLILQSTRVGEWVYDPFGGSGSTLIACEHTNRKCLMIEIEPDYVNTIVERWEQLTGKKAS